MIRHDHVATDDNIVILGSDAERAKYFVYLRAREQREALICIERHEIKG
jgi:hypothetical protein